MDSFFKKNMTNTFPVLHCILSNPVTAPSPQFFHRLAPHFPYILISFILSIIIKMGSCASQLINEELILLEHHHIGDSGMKKVISQHNTRVVKELDVAGNKLTPLSMELFPKVKWTSLTYLNFNKNKLGDMGCKYLSMATLNRVQSLILSHNNVGNAGVLHLSKAVWKNLKNLSLSFNRIQHQGAQCLSKAKWASIEQIQAYDNNLDEDFHLASKIILVTPLAQQALTPQKQKGKLPHDAFMNNGLLLKLH